MATTLKPVSFNTDKDADILDFIEDIDETYSSYVKRLIRQDMHKGEAVEPTPDTTQSDLKELITLMKQMLQSGMMMPNMAQMMQYQQMILQGSNVAQGTNKVDDTPEDEAEPEMSEEQKKAMLNIKNMFKK